MRYPRPVPGSRGMSIRPFAIVLVAALGLAGAGPAGSKTAPPTIRTQPTFFITGHGWGHGLGMGQYGAYGYAQHGWAYDRIIKHYYTGTTIGQAPVSRVRVCSSTARSRSRSRRSSRFRLSTPPARSTP